MNVLDDATRSAIAAAETRRATALVAQDLEALDALLHEDLVHIHTSGRVENKAQFLEGARDSIRFMKVERRSFELRPAGSAIVASGQLDQRVLLRGTGEEIEMDLVATQVWVPSPTGWKQLHYHATLRKR